MKPGDGLYLRHDGISDLFIVSFVEGCEHLDDTCQLLNENIPVSLSDHECKFDLEFLHLFPTQLIWHSLVAVIAGTFVVYNSSPLALSEFHCVVKPLHKCVSDTGGLFL